MASNTQEGFDFQEEIQMPAITQPQRQRRLLVQELNAPEEETERGPSVRREGSEIISNTITNNSNILSFNKQQDGIHSRHHTNTTIVVNYNREKQTPKSAKSIETLLYQIQPIEQSSSCPSCASVDSTYTQFISYQSTLEMETGDFNPTELVVKRFQITYNTLDYHYTDSHHSTTKLSDYNEIYGP